MDSKLYNLDVVISGVESGPNPSAGIGIAKSLRIAYPNARLHALDYSNSSTGLHHPVFDSASVCFVSSETDMGTHLKWVYTHLNQPGGCWISGRDSESEWLAKTIGEYPHLLAPGLEVHRVVMKPDLLCSQILGMSVPAYLPASSTSSDLQQLGRSAGWKLWIKGRYHGAVRVCSFTELRQQLNLVRQQDLLATTFAQQNIFGIDRSIVFSALKGQLIAAVEVEKQIVTSAGKAWAAMVFPVSDLARDRVSNLVDATQWTGGGEVEFVRDNNGKDWLIDVNPRFPATVYGSTLCGHNLPALLVRAAMDVDFAVVPSSGHQFVRAVEEIPVRTELFFPAHHYLNNESPTPSCHITLRSLSEERTNKSDLAFLPVAEANPPKVPHFLLAKATKLTTPCRIRDLSAVDDTVYQLEMALSKCTVRPIVMPALSIKTDPYPEIAFKFLEREWLAEVISTEELKWVKKLGFKHSRIVFNGPSVIQLVAQDGPCIAAAFADSIESFERVLESQFCDIAGLRIRPEGISSRFGVNLSDSIIFGRIVEILRRYKGKRKLGLHMHYASDGCGMDRWRGLVKNVLDWSIMLANASDATFSVFDIGGGWHPEDFRKCLLPLLPSIQAQISNCIPNLDMIILEPGKAITSESAWLVSRIIEVRSLECNKIVEVVVDASIADLPMTRHRAHNVLHTREGKILSWLGGGCQRILGCTCMEFDILADGVGFFYKPEQGDELFFASAGGYNASMAYHFGAGATRES